MAPALRLYIGKQRKRRRRQRRRRRRRRRRQQRRRRRERRRREGKGKGKRKGQRERRRRRRGARDGGEKKGGEKREGEGEREREGGRERRRKGARRGARPRKKTDHNLLAVITASACVRCSKAATLWYRDAMASERSCPSLGAISFVNFAALSPNLPCASIANGITSRFGYFSTCDTPVPAPLRRHGSPHSSRGPRQMLRLRW